MPFSPFEQMQKAVDVVNTSLHPANKIAATLFGTGPDGQPFSRSRVNYWPEPIWNAFGPETDIGNSSGTVHAETACILAAPFTDGARICITDPFCPNCAKNMAEAGIRTIYIDHKGFDKDFAARRGAHFENMSMQICARAGINVYELRRKEEKLIPILSIAPDYTPPNDSPVVVSTLTSADHAGFEKIIAETHANFGEKRFAVALASCSDGRILALSARKHLAIGFSKRIAADELNEPHSKYSFVLEPVNRILMNAARLGAKIQPDYLYASTTPTSRELVNAVGAGIRSLTIGDPTFARDDCALRALEQLREKNILDIGIA